MHPPLPAPNRDAPPLPVLSWRRWQRLWNQSLRFRLLALGVAPLLVAFPIILLALATLGGEGTQALLLSNARSQLAGSVNYLDQLKADAGFRIAQIVKSERLMHLLDSPAHSQELRQVLDTSAQASGLDFLIVATTDGVVVAASTEVAPGSHLPTSHAITQALVGVTTTAYELFSADQLAAFSPRFPRRARIVTAGESTDATVEETRGLMVTAAAPFPLTVNRSDTILVGGILLNNNSPLIEHMRQIIFPLGSLPEDAEGLATLFIGDIRIATSRLRQRGDQGVGTRIDSSVTDVVMRDGKTKLTIRNHLDRLHVTAYDALSDGSGQRIGMIGVGFPYDPYRKTFGVLLALVAGLLALAMLTLSVLFLRAGEELTQRLTKIRNTMSAVLQGNRSARVGTPLRDDELGALTQHFDQLLTTLEQQDAQERASQQAVTDEASRRRALFEHERDGVLILNADGSVFEANPQCTALLGYSLSELQDTHISHWALNVRPDTLLHQLASLGGEGRLFETPLQRKDGSIFTCEAALSRVAWGGTTFVLVLLRDITERKRVQTELDSYRQDLEALVEQRTRELNERSQQLDTIFTLSPDGFVSFDRLGKISFANPAFLHLTGLHSDAILGLDETQFSALIRLRCAPHSPVPDVAALRQARQQAQEGDTSDHSRRHLFELIAPAYRVLAVRIRLSEAATVSQILYFRDVTHETEVDRMKSEFLSTAAHELRTPMASVYGYTELLRMRDFDADRRHQILATISRQAERMSEIINELLDLARIEARRGKDFRLELVALQDIVADTIAGYQPPQGRPSPLLPSMGPAILVEVDRSKMQQVLLNILSNAYKYSPQGGDVVVRYCTRQRTDGSSQVGVEVQDHGIGMTAEQASRVCERFYRADTSGQILGTGLGMSIVKEIVELLGGEVEVHSAHGSGTTVCVWLPKIQ